jgi:ubiquinone/menaquinone biosynthesis C-methylase UbiE
MRIKHMIKKIFHTLLAIPFVYILSQKISGADKVLRYYVRQYIRPNTGDRILDIGCGPADILALLPKDVSYVGYDMVIPPINSIGK